MTIEQYKQAAIDLKIATQELKLAQLNLKAPLYELKTSRIQLMNDPNKRLTYTIKTMGEVTSIILERRAIRNEIVYLKNPNWRKFAGYMEQLKEFTKGGILGTERELKMISRNRRSYWNDTFEINTKFWALVPSLNINLNTREFEIEWLCFGIYLSK